MGASTCPDCTSPSAGTDKWFEERALKFRADLREVVSTERELNAISWMVVELLNEAHEHWRSTRSKADKP
jgi:hypothetical protein